MKKPFASLAFAALAASAFAAQVDRVLVRQMWPWSSEVRVEYTVSGTAAPAAVSFAFLPVASRFGFAPLFFVFALASVVYFAIAVCLERKCHVQTAM